MTLVENGRSDRRVLVTGVGLVTPIGIGRAEAWEGAASGRSGAGRITRFDPVDHACKIACEVKDFDPLAYLDRRGARRLDRASQMAVAAALLALEDAGLEREGLDSRSGINIASGNGGNEMWEAGFRTLVERGPERVSPVMLPASLVNMPAASVSMALGIHGPLSTQVTACASGTHSLGEALETIRRGEANLMLAGGTEAGVTPFCMATLDSTRALSRNNENPEGASRPYDIDRDGFVSAEGAAVLVLEEAQAAEARGATPLCELAGYGASADAHHLTEPAPDGGRQRAAMNCALADAGLGPEDVGYVNAHGTSTPTGDPVEIQALRDLLGPRAESTPVSSTKSMHGHAMGAAGGIEGALTALVLAEGWLPPTINLDSLDPECSGVDHVAHTGREAQPAAALSNSFGFGGHNAVIALRSMR